MDDLVERLRDAYPATQDMQHTLQGDLMDEAADAIEALQARVAEARRDAFEEAAKVADHIMNDYAELTYSPHHDRMQNAAKTYCAGEIAAAIRAMKGEKPFDILPEGHSVVRQEGTGGADFSGSVRAMKGE